MQLTEQTAVLGSALPVQALKDHLRLGSGFGEDAIQDGLVAGYLRAALAAIEGRIGKVLIARRFQLNLSDWRDAAAQALPVAPVTGIVSVTVFDAAGTAAVVPGGRYRLVADTHRPRLAATGVLLPVVPDDGRVEIVFDAGFGPDWADVPADLQQAVLLLAAEFHENRHDAGLSATGGLPAGVLALIKRWRTVRVLGGGA